MMKPIYFDNAATSFPKPDAVLRAMNDCMKNYCGNPGRGSHALALRASEKIFECRAVAAEMFGCENADGVILTLNTTYALNIAIKSVLSPGDHVLISDIEHNAVLRPVAALAENGVQYDIFSTDGDAESVIRDIRRKAKKNTKALVCTLASNICSKTPPSHAIGKFCRASNIIFIADGAQAAGHRTINMKDDGIDILCVPGHKGLYGPQGIGLMLSRIAPGKTVIEGGSGSLSADLYMPDFLPDRYEAGTLQTPAAAGLIEGMRFVSRIGCEKISAYEHELWRELYADLAEDRRFRIIDDTPSSVMLIDKSGMSPAEFASALDREGICVRAGLHCAPLAHKSLGTMPDGAVRISFGIFNTSRDIRRLRDALVRV